MWIHDEDRWVGKLIYEWNELKNGSKRFDMQVCEIKIDIYEIRRLWLYCLLLWSRSVGIFVRNNTKSLETTFLVYLSHTNTIP